MVKVRLRRRLLLKRHKKSAQSVTYNDGYGGYELPFTGSLSEEYKRHTSDLQRHNNRTSYTHYHQTKTNREP